MSFCACAFHCSWAWSAAGAISGGTFSRRLWRELKTEEERRQQQAAKAERARELKRKREAEEKAAAAKEAEQARHVAEDIEWAGRRGSAVQRDALPECGGAAHRGRDRARAYQG
jgi:hypothetical protein